MNLSLYLYIFLAIASIAGGSYYFFKNNSSIAGSIYLAGSVILVAYFGTRWFTSSGNQSTKSGTWPPVINVCPDFMSLVTITPAPTGTGTPVPETVCVDTAGIYSGGVAKWTPGSTSENTIFHLFATQDPTTRATNLCAQCNSKKVTWEGYFTDGTCGKTLPPVPPGTVVPTGTRA
jgi:hypothetical protein